MESLPLEMLRIIADFLPPQSRAALTVTSRRLLCQLGPAALRFERVPPALRDKYKFRFLLLLAKDPHLYPDCIPCPVCVCFHAPGNVFTPVPQDAIATTSSQLQRACEHDPRLQTSDALLGGSIAYSRWTAPSLSLRVHVNAIAGIMRSHRLGLDAYTPEMLSREDTVRKQYGDTLHQTTTYRIIQIGTKRHLVQKLELLLLLGKNKYACRPYERNAARHAHYSSTGGSTSASPMIPMLPPIMECLTPKNWEGSLVLTPRGRHQARHTVRSRYRSSTQVSQAAIGDVESCIECYTDAAFSIVDDLGPGNRVWVMTCWRDLGSDEQSDKNSIYRRFSRWVRGPCSEPEASERRVGSIYEAFERETGNYREGSNGWQAAPDKDTLTKLLEQHSRQADDGMANQGQSSQA